MTTLSLPPIVAAGVITDSMGRDWDPRKHPRGRDGKFIHTFKRIRAFLNAMDTDPWMTGEVTNINDDGSIRVRIKKTTDPNLVDPASGKSYIDQEVDITPELVESINEKAVLNADPNKPNAPKPSVFSAMGFGDEMSTWKQFRSRFFPDLGPAASLGGVDIDNAVSSLRDSLNAGRDIDEWDAEFKEKKGHDFIRDQAKYMVATRVLARAETLNGDDGKDIQHSNDKFRAVLEQLGVDPDVIDDTPDGLSGFDELAGRVRVWKNPSTGLDRAPRTPGAVREVEFGDDGNRVAFFGKDYGGPESPMSLKLVDKDGNVDPRWFNDFAEARAAALEPKASLTPNTPAPAQPIPPPEPDEIDPDVPDVEPTEADLDEIPDDTEAFTDVDTSDIRELAQDIHLSESEYGENYADSINGIASGVEEGSYSVEEARAELRSLSGEIDDEADDFDNPALKKLAKNLRSAADNLGVTQKAELDLPEDTEVVENEPEATDDDWTPEQLEVLDEYVSASQDINDTLRDVDDGVELTGDLKQYVDTMDEIIDSFSLTENTTLYRGLNASEDSYDFDGFLASLQPGKTIRDKAYMSTSLDQQIAGNFVSTEDNDRPGVFMEIEAPVGAAALPISAAPLDMMGMEEHELLLPRNSRLYIESVDTDPTTGVTLVKARLLDADEPDPIADNEVDVPVGVEELEAPVDTNPDELMTPEQRSSIKSYMAAGAALLNIKLRNNKSGDLADIPEDEAFYELAGVESTKKNVHEMTTALDELLESAPEVAPGTVLYRGMKFHPELNKDFIASLQPGTKFTDRGFMSTSKDPDVADGFSNKQSEYKTMDQSITFALEVEDEGIHGLDLDGFAAQAGLFEMGEQEVLLPRGVQTVIDDVQFDDEGNMHILARLRLGNDDDTESPGADTDSSEDSAPGVEAEAPNTGAEQTGSSGLDAGPGGPDASPEVDTPADPVDVPEDGQNVPEPTPATLADFPQPDLNSEENWAIHQVYGYAWGYKLINPYLHNNKHVWDSSINDYRPVTPDEDATAQKAIAALDSAFEKANVLDHPVIVERKSGLELFTDESMVGKDVVNLGYTSTATKLQKHGYGYESKPVHWVITLPEGTKAIQANAFEQEILLNRGAVFNVTEDTMMPDGVRMIKATYVLDGVAKEPDKKRVKVIPEPEPELLTPQPDAPNEEVVDPAQWDWTVPDPPQSDFKPTPYTPVEAPLAEWEKELLQGDAYVPPAPEPAADELPGPDSEDWEKMVDDKGAFRYDGSGLVLRVGDRALGADGIEMTITKFEPNNKGVIGIDDDGKKRIRHRKKLNLVAPTTPAEPEPVVDTDPWAEVGDSGTDLPAPAPSSKKLQDVDLSDIAATTQMVNDAKAVAAEGWPAGAYVDLGDGFELRFDQIDDMFEVHDTNDGEIMPVGVWALDTEFLRVNIAQAVNNKKTSVQAFPPPAPQAAPAAPSPQETPIENDTQLSDELANMLNSLDDGSYSPGDKLAYGDYRIEPTDGQIVMWHEPTGDELADIDTGEWFHDIYNELLKAKTDHEASLVQDADTPPPPAGKMNVFSTWENDPDTFAYDFQGFVNDVGDGNAAPNDYFDAGTDYAVTYFAKDDTWALWNLSDNYDNQLIGTFTNDDGAASQIQQTIQKRELGTAEVAPVSEPLVYNWKEELAAVNNIPKNIPGVQKQFPSQGLSDYQAKQYRNAGFALDDAAQYEVDSPQWNQAVNKAIYNLNQAGPAAGPKLAQVVQWRTDTLNSTKGGIIQGNTAVADQTLPEGFGDIPENAQAIYYYPGSAQGGKPSYAVVHENGDVYMHLQGIEPVKSLATNEILKNHPSWSPLGGVSVTTSDDANSPATPGPDLSQPHKMDMDGNPMFVGDKVYWSTKGVEVTVTGFENNDIGVIVKSVGPDGKPKKHAINRKKLKLISSTQHAHSQPANKQGPPNPTQSSLTAKKPDPDPNSPWFGVPQPEKPAIVSPKTPEDGKYIDDAWMDKANENYKNSVQNLVPDSVHKPLSQSYTYWRYVAAQKGDKSQLTFLLQAGWIPQELHDDALAQIQKHNKVEQEAFDKNAATFAKWSADVKAWRVANGLPSIQLKGMKNGVIKLDDYDAKMWMNDHQRPGGLTPQGKLSGPAHAAVQGQKMENISGALRMAKEKTLDPQWVAENGGYHTLGMDQAMLDSPPLEEDFMVTRTLDLNNFINPATGQPYQFGEPLSNSVGTIQHDWGFAETAVGSYDAGATAAFGADRDIRMELRLPKGLRGVWTEHPSQPSGYEEERGFILERGIAYYIHSATWVPNNYGSGGHWRVDAEVIPKDVDYDQFGHFINENPFFD